MKPERVKKVKLKSVNNVIFIYFCLLSALLLLLVDLVFYVVVTNILEGQVSDRVVSAGADIAMQLKHSPYDEVDKALFDRYEKDGLHVFLFTTEGEIVETESIISQSDVNDLISRISSASENRVLYSDNGFMNFATRVNYGSNEGVLLVSYPLEVVHNTIGAMQLYLLAISAVVLVIAFIISYNFSQKLTRGLKTMSDKAVCLAHGDYSIDFADADYKEMAQLSDSLNFVRDEVKKSEDFRREILANVTHDLKTPLTMIKAYASMVKEISGDDPEKRDKHLQVIIDETDRLTGLVNDVLNVSKVNSNIGEINLKVFNLTEFLYSIINKFGYLQNSGYSLMIDIDGNLYTRADEEKIGQVIYNLLGNAVNYTGEDKTVYISLKSSLDGSRIRLSVRDTGKGISKEDLPNIWDRYYRSEENHVRPVKGTGLGLSIVKAILQKHSFDFGVDSEQGKGSCFWVDFPAVSSIPDEP